MERKVGTLEYVQRGRAVRRYHNVRMLDSQRIDAHSYGVAQLVRFILPEDAEPARVARLICAALDHDLPEQVTGDIPAPTKRALPTEARAALDRMEREAAQPYKMDLFMFLDDEDARLLKIADAAEGCLHCIEERALGNQSITQVFHAFWSYYNLLEGRKASEELYVFITSRWVAVNGKWD